MGFEISTPIKLNIQDNYDLFIALAYIEEDINKSIRKKQHIEIKNGNSLNDYLMNEINNHYRKHKIDGIISNIVSEVKKNRLFKDDLLLIDKKNKRLINWIYCFLKKRKHNFKQNKEKSFEYDIRFHSNKENNSYDIRFNEITRFIKEIEIHKDDKITLINLLISEYKEIYKNDTIESWIQKNNQDKIIPWLFKYIEKEIEIDIENNLFNVISLSDKYNLILSFFDSYDDEIYKKYHIANIKKAWNQKKLREKNKEKKAYSFVMDKDIHMKLNFLSEFYGKTKNEIVQNIIIEKYLSLGEKD